jgi:hypothetical protein
VPWSPSIASLELEHTVVLFRPLEGSEAIDEDAELDLVGGGSGLAGDPVANRLFARDLDAPTRCVAEVAVAERLE